VKIYFFIRILFVIVILGINGCGQHPKSNPNKTYANDFALSPDGKVIVFSLSKGNRTSDLASYEISSGTVRTFKLTGDDFYKEPVFSPSGREIVFVAGKRLKGSNIYIQNLETGKIRRLTNTESTYPEREGIYYSNSFPNFSPDGKKIIFCRSAIVFKRANGGLMQTDWDLFEVDILTGAERKLTNHKFFTITRPYYLPSGKQFAFSATILNNKSGVGPKSFREYDQLYKDNIIFIMDEKNRGIKPAFVRGDSSRNPSVSGNGDIVFISKTNDLDGGTTYTHDLFIHNKTSSTRLTTRRFSYELNVPFISFNGSRVLFQADNRETGKPGWTVWIINRDGTGLKDINFMELLNKES